MTGSAGVARAALVTGAGGGIGGAVAAALGGAGYSVVVVDRDEAGARDRAEQITRDGGEAIAITADLSVVAAVRDVFARVDAAGLRLEAAVLVAGGIRYASLLDQDETGFDDLVAANLKSTFFCLQESARRMVRNGSGSIVTFASTAAYVAGRTPNSVYGMTKGGIRQLTVAAAVELAPHGVRVNGVAPATVRTAFTQDTLREPDQVARAQARIPLGRIGEPEDVVGAVMYLTSSVSDYVTGQVLVVDGGLLGRAG